MRFLLLTGFLFFLLTSCSRKEATPAGVLPVAKMKDVLWDVMRADQFLANFVFSRDTSVNKRTASIRLYRQVFRIHGVTHESFQQSLDYYLAHPAMFKVILDSVTAKSPDLPPPVDSTETETQTDTIPAPVKDTAKPVKALRPVDVN